MKMKKRQKPYWCPLGVMLFGTQILQTANSQANIMMALIIQMNSKNTFDIDLKPDL
jgi:hypothetical protein